MYYRNLEGLPISLNLPKFLTEQEKTQLLEKINKWVEETPRYKFVRKHGTSYGGYSFTVGSISLFSVSGYYKGLFDASLSAILICIILTIFTYYKLKDLKNNYERDLTWRTSIFIEELINKRDEPN